MTLFISDYYPDVTALFCDIVHFLQIVGSSKPIEIVNFINCLYSRFDRVTKIHDTYRVNKSLKYRMLTFNLFYRIGRLKDKITYIIEQHTVSSHAF